MNDQQQLDDDQLETITTTISKERMQTYMVSAGHDRSRAMQLYMWNAKLGEAFHIAIQALEVGLRNAVNLALSREYGEEWWSNQDYLNLLDHDREDDLKVVQRRIRNRQLPMTNGQVVAGLSFGFWVGMLQPRYNPAFWSKQIKFAFPNLPNDRSRKSIAKAAAEIATLRNRISHHEPLLKRDPLSDYALIMRTLEWICPTTAAWVRPHCRVPEIVRQRP
jgi:Abi-like protein